jgi:hypothetical protein
MKIRLEGATDQCDTAVHLLNQVMTVDRVSRPQPVQGNPSHVRVYVDVELPSSALGVADLRAELGLDVADPSERPTGTSRDPPGGLLNRRNVAAYSYTPTA